MDLLASSVERGQMNKPTRISMELGGGFETHPVDIKNKKTAMATPTCSSRYCSVFFGKGLLDVEALEADPRIQEPTEHGRSGVLLQSLETPNEAAFIQRLLVFVESGKTPTNLV